MAIEQTTFCANPKCRLFKVRFPSNRSSSIMILDPDDDTKRVEVNRYAHVSGPGMGPWVLLCDTCTEAINIVSGRSHV